MQIAARAGVRTAPVRDLLEGHASHSTEALAQRLQAVLGECECRPIEGVRPGCVPVDALLPLIEHAISMHGIESTARFAGLHTRRLTSIRGGHTQSVSFPVADRILGLDSPMRWWSDPALRRWLWGQHGHDLAAQRTQPSFRPSVRAISSRVPAAALRIRVSRAVPGAAISTPRPTTAIVSASADRPLPNDRSLYAAFGMGLPGLEPGTRRL